jgi:NADH:ubiquinone oxidoreductase subunit 3 (subunit A)
LINGRNQKGKKITAMSPILVFLLPVVVVLIICFFLTWFFLHKARQQEKLLRLEKGLEPMAASKSNGSFLLRTGIVIIGISIAIGIDTIMSRIGWFFGDGVSIAIVGIFGGTAMILANKVAKTNEQ